MELIFDKEWVAHSAPIYALTQKNEADFFTAGADKIAALWNVDQANNLPFHVKIDFGIYHVHFESSNNCLYISQSKGGVHVIDINLKKETAYLLGHKKGVYKTLVIPQEQTILTLGGDGVCSFWDINTHKHITALQLSSGKLRDAFFDSDQGIVWIAGAFGVLTAIDMTNLKIKNTYELGDDALYTVCQHPTNKNMLLIAGKDALIYVIHTTTGKIISFPAHNFGIYTITPLTGTPFFASCSRDKSIKIWNSTDFSFVQKLERTHQKGHTASVNNIIWLPSHKQLISVGDDKRIIAWKAT
jgi:WD40 repeat protein